MQVNQPKQLFDGPVETVQEDNITISELLQLDRGCDSNNAPGMILRNASLEV